MEPQAAQLCVAKLSPLAESRSSSAVVNCPPCLQVTLKVARKKLQLWDELGEGTWPVCDSDHAQRGALLHL